MVPLAHPIRPSVLPQETKELVFKSLDRGASGSGLNPGWGTQQL